MSQPNRPDQTPDASDLVDPHTQGIELDQSPTPDLDDDPEED